MSTNTDPQFGNTAALYLAERYSLDWNSHSPDAIRLELPFRIRPENRDVQHFFN